jgi:putative ABC transport system ATP-binding protein
MRMQPTRPLLHVVGLRKRYGERDVLAGVDFSVEAGECVALTGESGVGKSTLLNCIAGLDSASAGEVWLGGEPMLRLPEPQQARLRRERLGFVFQAFHVLPHLSVADNVALPLMLLGRSEPARVMAMLDAVGLADRAGSWPAELSGGQLQRVAIARALVHRPPLLLADEPTGNLDPETATRILDVLWQQVRQEGAALLLVTHSRTAAARADRRWILGAEGIRAATDGAPHAD